jgi:hypothetical protein
MKSVNWPKPGYASITCSTISNIPYNEIFTTKFNDSLILITIISCDYLNLSLTDEHVDDVTIPTQVIEYNQNFLQTDYPIRLKYSNQIKLYTGIYRHWKEYVNIFVSIISVNRVTKQSKTKKCALPSMPCII